MPRDLIFDSIVDDGIPSLAAAPNGPATRPLQSLSVDSIISISRNSRPFETGAGIGDCVGAYSPENHRPSTVSVWVSATITARSITFCSSLILPGQEYAC